MNVTAERINRIIRKTAAARYLEIGVCRGETFFAVDAPFKVAVDPAFQFDTADHESGRAHFFSMPSDDFFTSFAESDAADRLREEAGAPLFDVVFIDGLHTFEQAYRDFINSLRYTHDKAVCSLEEPLPNAPYSALADNAKSSVYRELPGVADASWHGEVHHARVALPDWQVGFFIRLLALLDMPHSVPCKVRV